MIIGLFRYEQSRKEGSDGKIFYFFKNFWTFFSLPNPSKPAITLRRLIGCSWIYFTLYTTNILYTHIFYMKYEPSPPPAVQFRSNCHLKRPNCMANAKPCRSWPAIGAITWRPITRSWIYRLDELYGIYSMILYCFTTFEYILWTVFF